MESDKHWLVRARTIRWLWVLFILILAFTVAIELSADLHGHFGIDESFGFHAWYGFLTCVAMIAVAKILGIFLKRRDTYYDE
ncbi:MAG: hypothetical protein JSW10_00030 [Pseudomonadota bacterium]|nr:MAG: hypothetical protein JSW10_00030 [Pseudomonadota bacterium]